MKKYLIMAFSCLMALGFAIGLTACGEHDHKFNWQTTVEATCTQEGSRKGVCEICGEEKIETIEKLPHDFDEWLVTQGATCQDEGSREHTCKVCGFYEAEIMPITEHTPIVTEVAVEPKCEQPGKTEEIKCSFCGDVIQESEEIPALEHKYGEWKTIEEATCKKEGQQRRVCEICDHPDIEQIPQKPHNWGVWQYDSEHDEHKHQCQDCQTIQSYACDYPEGDPLIIPATCTTDGKEYKVCTICGNEKIYRPLDRTGHSYEIIPILVEEETEGHVHKHYEKCSKCGDSKAPVECNLQKQGETIPATCITPEYENLICEKCKAVHEEIKAPAKGHEWVYDKVATYPTARHNKHCKNCDTPTVNEGCTITADHKAANCNEGASSTYTCTYCQNTRTIPEAGGKPLGHNWGPWKYVGSSKDDAWHEHSCQRADCQETEKVKCTLVSTTTHPTCTDAGKVDWVCDDCDQVFTEQGDSAQGHQWSTTWQIDEENGTHYRVCEKCQEHEQAQTHNFDEFETLATCGKDGEHKKVCQQCKFTTTERIPANAAQHNWTLSSIQEGKHIARCTNCEQVADGEHDFSESNLCSVCGYDGLEYKIDGKHATVLKSEKVKNAKEIIIEPFCKQLDEQGHYKTTEYEVTIIDKYAFMNFNNMTKLTLPYTLVTIGENAFSNCTHLQTVTLVCNDSDKVSALESIGRFAFYYCTALQTFNPPDTLKFIGEYAFANCKTLHEITIPDDVETIEPNAFYGTDFTSDSSHWKGGALYLGKHLIKVRNEVGDGSMNTTFVVAPGTLTIAADAFAECTELQNLTLPGSLTRIDRDAFANCNKISSVTFTGTIAEWLGILFVNDLSSPLCNSSTGLHLAAASGVVDLTDTSYTNGRTITHIPAGTFRGTEITSIILPNTLTYIGEEAFENCASLESITFPQGCKVSYVGKDVLKGSKYYNLATNWHNDKVLYIDNVILIEAKKDLAGDYTIQGDTTVVCANAFNGCTGVTNITIDGKVVYIGEHAFDGCQKLTFKDKSYSWMCNSPLLNISRSMSNEDLSIDTYRTYNGEWRRLAKVAAAA